MKTWVPIALLASGLLSLGAQDGTKADLRVDVDMVRVTCLVTDRHGAPVTNLRPEDFDLREEGVPQQVKHLWREADLPLTIGLIIDVSGSQAGLVDKHRHTVTEFVTRVIGPEDQAFLVTVAGQQRLLTDLTNSASSLIAGVNRLERNGKAGAILGEPCGGEDIESGCGGTALWNGVYYASRMKMRPMAGRKALVLVTDGWDTGSDHSLTNAIEAAQGADTVVYTIRFVSPLMYAIFLQPPVGMYYGLRHNTGRALRRIAAQTGGRSFRGGGKLPEIFSRIEDELRNQYVLAYTPSIKAPRGTFRKLDVRPTRPGLTIRARKGYYVPE